MKKFERFRISNWPLWVQIFAIITILFGLFIALQQFVTYNIFSSFYDQTQASSLKDSVISYTSSLNENEFDAMFSLSKNNSAQSVILDSNNEVITSDANYSIWLGDEEIKLSSIIYNFNISDDVTISYGKDSIVSIKVDDKTLTYSNNEITKTVSGKITQIKRPINLNSQFIYQNNVIKELDYHKNGNPKYYTINDNISWYVHQSNKNDLFKNLVFISKLDNGNSAITIFSVQATNGMIANLNVYNFYTYVIILLVILVTSWYISKIIAKPFENITYVADQISNLNFEVSAKEFTNRESTTLTNSINKMNNSLKDTIDKLNNQNNEMRELSLQKEKQYETKKQFVSAISHEIKTPLAIIQATVSGILDGIFEESDVNSELKNVLKEVNNTTDMLQEVLDVYRLDSDSFKLELERLDLVNFTQKIINSFELVLSNSEMSINYTYEEKEVFIQGDYRQLKRVLSNLIVNAIKYSPEKNVIDVALKTSKKEVLLEVTNYGVNIPEEDISNVFEPFYRVDKTGNRTERKKGSGLGLYIVKQVLDKHGFSFGIKNIDNGVTFYFVAPKDNA